MRTLLIRSVSGLVYASILTIALLLDKVVFSIVILIIGSLTVLEFQKLIGHLSMLPVTILAMILYFDYAQLLQTRIIEILVIVALLVNIGLIHFLFQNKVLRLRPVFKLLISLIYIVAPCYLLVTTTQINEELREFLTLAILALIWVNDSVAFLIGKTFGKRKLFKSISPKKTIEGSLGGLILTLVVAYIAYSYQSSYGLYETIIIAFSISIFATIGDLIQSKFKRLANVKDSGKVIPGHGGMYDRLDSTLFSIPFVYMLLFIFSDVS